MLYGTAAGLTAKRTQQISEVTPGIKGYEDDAAPFGTAPTVIEPFWSETHPTLVVAAPSYGGRNECDRSGMIHLIHGSMAGLTAARNGTLRAKQFPQRPVGDALGNVMTS